MRGTTALLLVAGLFMAAPASAGSLPPRDDTRDAVYSAETLPPDVSFYDIDIGYRHTDAGVGGEIDLGLLNVRGNWALGDSWRVTGAAFGDVFDNDQTGTGETFGASGGIFYVPGMPTSFGAAGFRERMPLPRFVVGVTGGIVSMDIADLVELDMSWAGGTGKIYGDMFNFGGTLGVGRLDQVVLETDYFYANLHGQYFLHDRFSAGATYDHVKLDLSGSTYDRVGLNLEWQPWSEHALSLGFEVGNTWIGHPGFVDVDDIRDFGFRLSWAGFGGSGVTPTLLERSWFTYNAVAPRDVRNAGL